MLLIPRPLNFCLNVFWWARFRQTKGGIKVHTLFDITTQIPTFIHITPAAVHDMIAMDHINYDEGAYYVFDRGYVDFSRLNTINKLQAFKLSSLYAPNQVLSIEGYIPLKLIRLTGVIYDQTGKLTGFYTSNNMEITAYQVALLYKNR